MRSRPILALMVHQDWLVCTVWRYSQSVFEHHTLWAEPRHVLGSTLPGLITYQNRLRHYVFIQHDQGVGLWLNCFILVFFFLAGRGLGGAERNCDCLAHHRPHITASSHHATVSHSPNVCMHLRFGSPSFNAHTSHIAYPSWPGLCPSIR